MKRYNLRDIDFVNLLFLTLTPLIAILLTVYWAKVDGFMWGQLALGLAFYLFTGFSITAGYHRLFAHRIRKIHFSTLWGSSFPEQCPKVVCRSSRSS